jgi:hypothetical protein
MLSINEYLTMLNNMLAREGQTRTNYATANFYYLRNRPVCDAYDAIMADRARIAALA